MSAWFEWLALGCALFAYSCRVTLTRASTPASRSFYGLVLYSPLPTFRAGGFTGVPSILGFIKDVDNMVFKIFSFRGGGSLIASQRTEPTNYRYQHCTGLWYSPSHYLASQLTDLLKVCICMYGIPSPPRKKY